MNPRDAPCFPVTHSRAHVLLRFVVESIAINRRATYRHERIRERMARSRLSSYAVDNSLFLGVSAKEMYSIHVRLPSSAAETAGDICGRSMIDDR